MLSKYHLMQINLVLSVTKCRGLPNFQWFAKLEYVFPLALREMNNFVEFLEPWYFTIPDESQIRARRVGKRGVSESVMLLTPVKRRVMTSHALGKLIAACQRISRVWYLTAQIYFVVKSVSVSGIRALAGARFKLKVQHKILIIIKNMWYFCGLIIICF